MKFGQNFATIVLFVQELLFSIIAASEKSSKSFQTSYVFTIFRRACWHILVLHGCSK